jgi:hypothetical protein
MLSRIRRKDPEMVGHFTGEGGLPQEKTKCLSVANKLSGLVAQGLSGS